MADRGQALGTRAPLGPISYIYRPQRSWGKVIFSETCVNNSVHRGGGGHAWLHRGVCVVLFWGGVRGFILGGMHGFILGACVVLFWGSVCGFIWGACVVVHSERLS